jgi:hypothetical protein
VTFNDAAWFEPFSTTSINNILGSVSSFRVASDIPYTGTGTGILTNNQRTAIPIAIVVGTGPIVYGVFNDLGDSPTGVPDTGTTASLFGFSLAGLAFLRRKLGHSA